MCVRFRDVGRADRAAAHSILTVSKASAAKKARRKRRLAARNDRWLPADVQADVEGVAHIANQIVGRGWEFDREFSTENFITWYLPAVGDRGRRRRVRSKPVTRIWLSDPEEPHVILVGSGSPTWVD